MNGLVFLGRGLLRGIRVVGDVALVLARTLLSLSRLDRVELVRDLFHFGFRSLPLALVVAVVTGATAIIQTSLYTERFGARGYLGWAAGYAVLHEFGPLLLGLLLAARVGARNAAELATLTVGDQLLGLRGIGVDPFALLVAPRVVAITVSAALLSGLVFAVAIALEALSALWLLHLPLRVFGDNLASMVGVADFAAGLIKTTAFGLAMALLSTSAGMRAVGGARAVGDAAASAVVRSCAAIFLLDFALTAVLRGVLG